MPVLYLNTITPKQSHLFETLSDSTNITGTALQFLDGDDDVN